jgi:hypothetical protein
MTPPEIRYARSSDLRIAYQVVGTGPLDLVFVPGFVSNIDLLWEMPEWANFYSRLAAFSRLILLDKRGTGLSDRVAGIATLEERMDRLQADYTEFPQRNIPLDGLGRARIAHEILGRADAVLIPTLSGEADITDAEKTVRLAEGLARAARRDIPARVLLNRVKRTQLARHAAREIEAAGLPLLTTTLSDLVAYGEMSFSGRIPDLGLAGDEVSRLVAELRALGWISTRQDVLA